MNKFEFLPRPSFSPRMSAGDKLHLRLRFTDGSEIIFHTDTADSIESLVGRVRTVAGSRRGLARMSVRNVSRGWTVEKPLMLGNGV